MNVCSQRGKACVLRTAFNKECGALARMGSVGLGNLRGPERGAAKSDRGVQEGRRRKVRAAHLVLLALRVEGGWRGGGWGAFRARPVPAARRWRRPTTVGGLWPSLQMAETPAVCCEAGYADIW